MRGTFMTATMSGVMLATLLAVTGPSSSKDAYLLPRAAGVEITSILTVGDTVKKKHKGNETYRMVGIPDGLGAYDNGDGTFTVLMNHELRAGVGIARDHGGNGAFVSKWQIRKSDLKVLNGEDLIQKVMLYDVPSQSYVEIPGTVFSRFCSADLPPVSAFYNAASGKGFNEGRIYMNGEEDGATGRAMAHCAAGRDHGTSYEFFKMGHHAWENLLASPTAQDKTVVIGTEDGGLNKVFLYVGEKQDSGNPVELAGLTNGALSEIKIDGFTSEPPLGFGVGIWTPVASGGTSFLRPEDGHWDPTNPNWFYFVTTASITGNSRLWRLSFNDIAQPELGGKIEVIIDGNLVPAPQIKMMDNIVVDGAGNVIALEDVGGNSRLGKVWKINPFTKTATMIAEHDPALFSGPTPLTIDEEASGVIEVTDLFQGVPGYDTAGNRYFLLDTQAHFGIADPELVEGGQLMMMKVPN